MDTLSAMSFRGQALRNRSWGRALRWLVMVVMLSFVAPHAVAATPRAVDGIALVANALAAEAAPARASREEPARGVLRGRSAPVRAVSCAPPNDGVPVIARGRIYLRDCALLR
ncbi:hypothetical protein LZC95_01880 [Pendulispora brunnea]|uniref:Uncharacterized protein n=1 Tax=Pendulispora brunnea TaxID=2905690 RepID=A0ABZ2KAC6_9BACT